ALDARARQGEARPQADEGDQDHARGRGRGREAGRRDQGALREDFPRVRRYRHARHPGLAFGQPECKPCAGHPRLGNKQGADGWAAPGHDEWLEHRMRPRAISRRNLLKTGAAAGAALFAAPLRAQAPAATAVTPALVAAAQKEGKVAFYTAM